MDYGDKYGINDSKLSKAYLELVYRAVMLKEKNPEMRFRSIKVVQISKDGTPNVMEVDMQPYLYAIGDYYKANKPEIYAELQKRNLLDASSYKGVASSVIELYDSIAHLSRKEQLLYLNTKLSSLHLGKTRDEIQNDPNIRTLSKLYTEAILEIQKESGVDLSSKTEDLSSLWGFKNFSDVDNPKVQTLHKLLLNAKKETSDFSNRLNQRHDELYAKILKATDRPKLGLMKAALNVVNVYGLFTFNPLWFVGSILAHRYLSRTAGVTTKDHFAFMWRKSTDPAKEGYFLNTRDTYFQNGMEVPLTEAQKEYRDFIYSSMKSEYDAFANEIVGYRKNIEALPITRATQLGLPSELPVDFMPRVPKPIEEIREEEAFSKGFFGLKTNLGISAKNALTSFLEDRFETQGTGLPLRYFKHSNSSVVTEASHSWNVEQSFKFFMTSLKTKQKLDPLYDIALGVSNALKEDKTEDKKPRYDNLVRWLDDQITIQIEGSQKDTRVSKRKITLKANALTEKLTDIPKGTPIVVSQDRLLKFLKTSVTYSVMSFKVWSPIRNALLIAAGNMTQSTRGVINGLVSKIVGVPPESLETVNLAGGRIAMQSYIKDKMFGKEDESKLWNIAKKFDWLPDNYPYEVNNDRLLSKANQLGLTSNAFIFYELGENLGALWQLAGLMKSLKIKDKEGNEKSM